MFVWVSTLLIIIFVVVSLWIIWYIFCMLIHMNVDILLGTHRSCDGIASGGVLRGVVVAASVIGGRRAKLVRTLQG